MRNDEIGWGTYSRERDVRKVEGEEEAEAKGEGKGIE